MPENNDQNVFFVDDDLIERLLRGDAVEAFQASLKENATNDHTLFGKAVALHQLGKLDEAAELYRKLLPANPNSADLLVNLIALSSARKDDGKVKEFAERLLKLRPQS